jgi:acyl carrier protein
VNEEMNIIRYGGIVMNENNQKNDHNIKNRLLFLAKKIFPEEENLTLDSRANETYGWDSLGNMNFIAALEEEFDIEFNEEEYFNMLSIREIYNVLYKRLKND